MQYLLSRASRPILDRIAREHALCAFDFDGTLAPIVTRPEQAGMRQRTRELLACLADLYPCVVISGRARADVLAKLDAAGVDRVIGNHGAEDEVVAPEERHRVEEWKATLQRAGEGLEGVWVEDKGLSLAVHYRQAVKKAEARRRIAAAAQDLRGARVFGGKQVVNVVPAEAPDKREALARERERQGCDWVLFAGDDVNDEEAFGLPGNTVSVRVGRKRGSRAKYYLRSQAEIDDLLEHLIALRRNVSRS